MHSDDTSLPAEDPNPSGLCMCGCGRKTKIFPKNDAFKGYRKGHHRRYIHGHNRTKPENRGKRENMGPYDPECIYTIEDRGYLSACWAWQGSRDADGYGLTSANGQRARAHRLYYIERCGDIPDGLELDHLCRQPDCVNPDHLEAVTHAENMRRGKNTKLTADDVRFIRSLPELQRGQRKELAQRFGVHPETITNVRTRKKWKSLL